MLSWLGAHYSKSELYERAVVFFQRGALLDPSDLKWMLLIAGCYRKLRNYQQAKEIYEAVVKKDPDNMECKF